MRHTALLAAAVLGLAPGAALAQAPAPTAHNPAERLLEHRAELALSAEQVKQLEAIDRRVDERDAKLRVQLEQLRGKPAGEPLRMRDMSAAQREELLAKRAELQPLMQQLRTLHLEAATDARAVLNAEQNAKARSFLFVGPGQGQGRGPAAGGPRWRGQGAGRGMGPARMGRGWSDDTSWPGRGRGRGW